MFTFLLGKKVKKEWNTPENKYTLYNCMNNVPKVSNRLSMASLVYCTYSAGTIQVMVAHTIIEFCRFYHSQGLCNWFIKYHNIF